MARDTGTDASTPLDYDTRYHEKDGYTLRGMPGNKMDGGYGDDYIYISYRMYKMEKPEKIETGKSDVQPMVEDDWEDNFWDNIPKERYNPLKEFDEGIKGLTDRRGDVYGHPKDDFDRIIQMQKALDDCDDEFARHIMNMICVKMSRLVKTPDHSDSWLDIVGYVRTWFMIKEKRNED